MQFLEIKPYIFKIGTLEVRWYGLMYILGFLAAYLIAVADAKRKKLPLTKDDIADLIFVLALGLIVGARFGYALFYNVSYYLANPFKVFAVWEGGMSFHGGLIGAVLAALYFGRKKKIGFFQIADLITPAAPIGLGLGRLGNFINGVGRGIGSLILPFIAAAFLVTYPEPWNYLMSIIAALLFFIPMALLSFVGCKTVGPDYNSVKETLARRAEELRERNGRDGQ